MSNPDTIARKIKRRLVNYGRLVTDPFTVHDGLVKRRIANHHIYLDPNDKGISRSLRFRLPDDQDREPAFMTILQRELQPGMTALDLGANIGHVTLHMAEAMAGEGTIYAFEPSSHNYRILERNIDLNGLGDLVDPFHVAVSNQPGQQQFFISEATNLGGMTRTKHTTSGSEVVETITLDDFFRDRPPPNFIKMDIEGHEVEVLDGAFETLRTAPSPVRILMEVHPIYYSEDHSLEVQMRRLLEVGFRARYVVSAGIARPDFFVEHGYEPKEIFQIGKFQRAIYDDVSDEHMIVAACRQHRQFNETFNQYVNNITRSVMIEK